MPAQIGLGFSDHINPEQAAQEASFQSKTNLGADRIDLAIVLTTIHYDPILTIPVLQRVLNNAPLLGCSSAGIINSHAIKTRGISVLTLCSDDIKFGTGSVTNIDTLNPREEGVALAIDCLNDFGKHPRQLSVFLIDGLIKNSFMLLKGIQEVLGDVFPIVGAGTSDDFNFLESFQIFKEHKLAGSAVGLILGGHMSIGIGARHGWRPLGKPRIINKSEGNIILEIDHKPAIRLYEEYFQEKAYHLGASKLDTTSILYPLGIFIEGSDEYLLRNAINVLEDGSIVCQGEVPQGAEVHIMIGNKSSCKQSAYDAALEAQKNLLGKVPNIIIVFESMSRLKLLGRMAYEEISEIREVFGPNIPIFGMYSNGEICPMQTAQENFKKPHIQNGTIVVLAIG
ncbi:MAG: FIST C-terminal domain-containing protein [Candidatus Omnitrophica bacterium]|nr:FIST C-terminal domain-containing protein [Candidatus Omnitrophota bacterium]